MISVCGIDGARQGWVVVRLHEEETAVCMMCATFADAMEASVGAAAVAVDMPIGLESESFRRCDLIAREFVGPRRSSIFVTPPRRALELEDYAAAVSRCKELTGSGFSKQAWGLRTKILELEKVIAVDARIYETHPEVCFAAMNGETLSWPKKTWNGQMLRRQLLANNGIRLRDDLGSNGVLAPDDVLDAAAAAWAARRIALGRAERIPLEDGPAIWF